MANEAKKNDIKGAEDAVLENNNEVVADVAVSDIEFVDTYADRRNEEGIEEIYLSDNDTEIIPTNVPLNLLTSSNTNSGREYHNVATSWKHRFVFDGVESVEVLTVEFGVSERRNGYVIKQLYDRIVKIFEGRKTVPLEIVKSTRTDRNNKKTTSWAARCSRKGDDGILYSVTLRPVHISDEENFKILLSKLSKANERIGFFAN